MKLLLLANSDWFLYRFNSELARALIAAGCEVVLASPPGEFAQRLAAGGLDWQAVPLARRELRPLAELRTLRRLRSLYRRERPDLVHHFTLKAALYGSLAARLAGTPAVVNSITGLGYLYSSSGPRVRALRFVMERAARRLLPPTHVIFLNRDDRRHFLERRLASEERSEVILGSGVDTGRFSPAAAGEERDASAALVVLVGRLLWSKGVGELVEAARRLRERGLAARIALVGATDPGNPDSIAQEQLAAWRREGLLELWGFRDDMVEVYRRADVVCLPGWYREGVPTALLEAAACGRPVVASDMPGCRETVADGTSGLLVPPRDALALADALERLIADPQLRARMGRAGRRRVVEGFSVERVVAATFAVYRRACPSFPAG